MNRQPNRYARLLERVFQDHYRAGDTEVVFERDELARIADELGVTLPKNLGDIPYAFRYRAAMPASIQAVAPKGLSWVIRPAGRGRYCFAAVSTPHIVPSEVLSETKVPDATPGVIAMYALNDEQALLAKLRYNRLVDVFTGTTCYSLQSHLRTAMTGVGQVETDEVYIGLDRRGVHYVFPIQAKGGRDLLSIVQIEQDVAMCKARFGSLVCRPIGAQFMKGDLIALFEFEMVDGSVSVAVEKHYRLVPPEELTAADLELYRTRTG